MIRSEKPEDYKTIFTITLEAFGTDKEAGLIDKLRKTSNFNPELSLIALEKNQLVGYLLLYPVTIEADQGTMNELGLGPIAVKPEWQAKGIGTKLIREGLKKAKQLNYRLIVVVGNPNYYKRFGFVKGRIKDLKVALDVPEEDFLVLELTPNTLNIKNGLVKYSQEFESI